MKIINRARVNEETPFRHFATRAMESFEDRLIRTYRFKLTRNDYESNTYERGDVTVTLQKEEDFLQVNMKGKVFTFNRIGENTKFYLALEGFINSFFGVEGFVR